MSSQEFRSKTIISKSSYINDPRFKTSNYETDVMQGKIKVARIAGDVNPANCRSIWLHHFKVEEGFRNRGIGKKLMGKFIAWARTTPSDRIELALDIGDPSESIPDIQSWLIRHFSFAIIRYNNLSNPELFLKLK